MAAGARRGQASHGERPEEVAPGLAPRGCGGECGQGKAMGRSLPAKERRSEGTGVGSSAPKQTVSTTRGRDVGGGGRGEG